MTRHMHRDTSVEQIGQAVNLQRVLAKRPENISETDGQSLKSVNGAAQVKGGLRGGSLQRKRSNMGAGQPPSTGNSNNFMLMDPQQQK